MELNLGTPKWYLAVALFFATLQGSLFISHAWALDPAKSISQFNHKHWQTKDGLPQSTARAIAQTTDGYIWIGTSEGLTRFDGANFTIFDKSNSPALTSDFILTLFASQDGNLWIGTQTGGLIKFKDGSFQAFNKQDGLSSNLITTIVEDNSENLWIGTPDGLNRFKDGKFTSYSQDHTMTGRKINALAFDDEGKLWVATNAGLAWYQNGIFHPVIADGEPLSFSINTISVDGDRGIWLGTDDGLKHYQNGRVVNHGLTQGLPQDTVNHLFLDHEQSLWVGTLGSGLRRYRRDQTSSYTTSDGLPNSNVKVIHGDTEGNLWVGLYTGGIHLFSDAAITSFGLAEGISAQARSTTGIHQDRRGTIFVGAFGGQGLYTYRNGKISHIGLNTTLISPSGGVLAITEFDDGRLLFGTTNSGLLLYQNGQFSRFSDYPALSQSSILSLFIAPTETVWVGTKTGLYQIEKDKTVTSITTDTGLSNNVVRFIFADTKGRIWIGTNDGLNLYQENKFSVFRTKDGLSNDTVISVHEDDEGNLWFGTYGGGINLYRNEMFTSFQKKDGLFNDVVYAILEDAKGNLWMSSNKGISSIHKQQLFDFASGKISRLVSISYGVSDGMKSPEGSGGLHPPALRAADGKLYFPNIKGFVQIDPSELRKNEVPPKVHIENIVVDGHQVNAGQLLRLPADTSRVEFHYVGLSYAAHEAVTYEYKLEGYDETWVKGAGISSANYTNLGPGSYRFLVRAANQDGVWSKRPASVQLHRAPHFYETLWFYMVGVLLVILLFYAVYRIRLGQIISREAELEAYNTKLQEEVQSQTRDLSHKTREAQIAAQEAVAAKEQADISKTKAEYATQEALRQKAHAETARQESEQLKREAIEHANQLKFLDQQKTTFFQNISHELRTPLTLILNPLENQSREQPNNTELKVATKNSRRLLRLVNQLLDFQKLEAGKKELQLAPLDISRFIHVCGDYFHSASSTNGISFSVKRDGELLKEDAEPLYLLGEADALEKIVFNYLSNALKYTPEGGEIELGLNTSKASVKLYVRDTGSGISEEGQQKLFKVFSQVDETTTRSYEGTGLGLALAKSLAEELDGQVGVDSKPGKGSVFWAEFPLIKSNGSILDVLLVDDEPMMRDTLDSALRFSDAINTIEGVGSVDEALDILESRQVRVVLTDYNLGGQDGLSLLEKVGTLYPRIARLLLTGDSDPRLMRKAVNQGLVDQVFHKPCENDELTAGIEKALQASTINAVDPGRGKSGVRSWLLADQSKTGADDTGVFKALDEVADGEGELVLVVDDLADMRDLIAGCLKKKNYRVATAPNGRRGLEIAKEIRPSLIVTDWMMPVMSGPELIEAVKEDAFLGSVPIILLTAKSDEESKLIGTEIGADAFLGKPFNDQELTSIVRNLLSLKSREREVEELNHQLTQVVLKRYLPPDLVDQIISGETSIDQEPEGITGTILFSDLAGFTDLSEQLRASKLARILNEYLAEMVQVIYEHGGTIDKFIGDAVMVIFGAPTSMAGKDQAKHAAACALAMQERMVALNQRWKKEKIPELKMRIGIHHGPVVVGTFGCDERSDYTAIGPTVNMASRIEGACEPGNVFISGELCDLLPEEMAEEAGSFQLKGIDGERRLYKLVTS